MQKNNIKISETTHQITDTESMVRNIYVFNIERSTIIILNNGNDAHIRVVATVDGNNDDIDITPDTYVKSGERLVLYNDKLFYSIKVYAHTDSPGTTSNITIRGIGRG